GCIQGRRIAAGRQDSNALHAAASSVAVRKSFTGSVCGKRSNDAARRSKGAWIYPVDVTISGSPKILAKDDVQSVAAVVPAIDIRGRVFGEWAARDQDRQLRSRRIGLLHVKFEFNGLLARDHGWGGMGRGAKPSEDRASARLFGAPLRYAELNSDEARFADR